MSEFLRDKPNVERKLRGWEDLDILLQSIFGDPHYKEVGMVRIDPYDFEMTKEDIIREAEDAGYTVDEIDGKIRFK